jgi:anti-sigma regulatory factor (Ser/Thr protein kinase)
VSEHHLPHDPDSARTARALAREALGDRLDGARQDDVVLMVTELVTNAVRHAPARPDGSIVLKLEVETSAARVVVIDGGGAFEFEHATFDARTPHFGLQLIDRMADRWGLSLDGEKAVWFEVDLSR